MLVSVCGLSGCLCGLPSCLMDAQPALLLPEDPGLSGLPQFPPPATLAPDLTGGRGHCRRDGEVPGSRDPLNPVAVVGRKLGEEEEEEEIISYVFTHTDTVSVGLHITIAVTGASSVCILSMQAQGGYPPL